MHFSQEVGIILTTEVKAMLREGIAKEGSYALFAKACNVPKASVGFWIGEGKRQGVWIPWDSWIGVRDCLSRHGLLAADEPRWLLPSEMLAELERLRAERGESATATATGAGSAAAAGSGARATAAPVTQITPSESETEAIRKLERLASWIIACPDISPEAKLRAMAIIHPD